MDDPAVLARLLAVLKAAPKPPQPEKLLTVRHLANQLRVRPEYVYRLERRGEIPSVRIGRKIRFSPKAIERYLRQCTNVTKDP